MRALQSHLGLANDILQVAFVSPQVYEPSYMHAVSVSCNLVELLDAN